MSERTKTREQLELMVDRETLHEVLNMLAEICGDKAEHLRANWQDEKEARCWEKVAAKIEPTADYALHVLG